MIDVTNSVADWHDFWYNSMEDLPDWTNNETPPINMTKLNESTSNSSTQTNNQESKSFDELYEEYSSLSVEDQLNNLKQLAREFVTRIDQVINHLDVILEEEDKTTD